jgi:hypothetical protein
VTAAQVRAARVLYERGWSIPDIAAETWERFGCPSQNAARMALQRAFIACGYRRRTKREAALLRHAGTCSGCGCAKDDRTRGCAICKQRHYRRKMRGLPYTPVRCRSCGVGVDERTVGCRTCNSRHWRRRYPRGKCGPTSALDGGAESPLRGTPSAARLPSGGGATPSSNERLAA